MPIVPALCTQCGANLSIDSTLEKGICPFCNTSFLIEKAIQYYINSTSDEIENLVKSANAFLKMKDYSSAENRFHRICGLYPYDYRGWWGILQIKSNDFTETDISTFQLQELEALYQKAKAVASDNVKPSLESRFIDYSALVGKRLSALKNDLNSRKASLLEQMNAIELERTKINFPSSIVFKVMATIVIAINLYMLIPALLSGAVFYGLLYFLGGMLVFGGMGYVIWHISMLFDKPYDKKIKALNAQLENLNTEKIEVERTYSYYFHC